MCGTSRPYYDERVPNRCYPQENRYRELRRLDGIWRFQADTDHCGQDKEWQLRSLASPVPMVVPASYNDLAGRHHSYLVGEVWYEREVLVPATWQDGAVYLRFGA